MKLEQQDPSQETTLENTGPLQPGRAEFGKKHNCYPEIDCKKRKQNFRKKKKIFMLKDQTGPEIYAGSPPAGKQLCSHQIEDKAGMCPCC